jgi:hypothetical protein
MKIEVGESLMRSWLRHIQGCQFAELNWKPSSSWSRLSDVQPLIDAARDRFKSALAADIFGTQTAYQLLNQGDIDVLGIEIGPNGKVVRVCSVDIAFHENGLNYSDVGETRNRVLKKLIRSTMIIRSVFGPLPQQAVFASPVVRRSYVSALDDAMKELKGFLSAYQIDCEAMLIVNDSFREVVLDPVIAIATDVADTSELFLRSYQLLRIFEPILNDTAAPRPTGRPDPGGTELLRFEFDPSPSEAFKSRLLNTKMARMTIHYKDGRAEDRIWNAPNFTESSNLIGNLRSRKEFRPGESQRRGISSVSLKIIE